MTYNETLAHRVRAILSNRPEVVELKMFGGLAFMLNGNMCCGILGDELIVRVGRSQYEQALTMPHAREFDFTGRPMRGLVLVAAPALVAEDDLAAWIERGLRFAETLPQK